MPALTHVRDTRHCPQPSFLRIYMRSVSIRAERECPMALRDRLNYLRMEEDEILRLLDTVEGLLTLASKGSFAVRSKAISDLHSLEHFLAGILEHCRPEERILESTYHRFLQPDERERIQSEHKEIMRLVSVFRDELRFATSDRIDTVIETGNVLNNRVREHIAFEQVLLNRIERLSALPESVIVRMANPPRRPDAGETRSD
jgi:hemerythrin-like domain-containing protein